MPRSRGVVLVVALGGAACGRAGDAGRGGGTPAGQAPASAPAGSHLASPGGAVTPPSGVAALTWKSADAGPVLLVAGSNSIDAALVLPDYTDSTLAEAPAVDTLLGAGTRVDLFARTGAIGEATIVPDAPGAYSGACTSWPSVHVRTAAGGAPPPWSVGFLAGHARPLPMDSVGDLAPRDSSRRAAMVVRVASALRDDTLPVFRGVPFTVEDAHRFVIPPHAAGAADSVEVIAAELVRRLNTEANPREEEVVLIMERPASAASSSRPVTPTAAYWDRISGAEDEVETSEIMAGVLLGPSRVPSIVVGRDDGDGGSYTLLERDAPHHWRTRWNSAYTGC